MPEIIVRLDLPTRTPLDSFKNAKDMFTFALDHVHKHRKRELDENFNSIMTATKNTPTPHKFLREYLWCVYVSGFSAACISKKYDSLLLAHNVEDENGRFVQISSGNILTDLSPVFSIFKNRAKASAVQKTRESILSKGWDRFLIEFDRTRPETLTSLPNIGPALSVHLARNLGNPHLVKPDVHLARLASKYGFSTVIEMCKSLSDEPLAKTDLILWLASVDHGTK